MTEHNNSEGQLAVATDGVMRVDDAKAFAKHYQLPLLATNDKAWRALVLVFGSQKLWLENRAEKKPVVTIVDFVEGANAHRRKFGGGRGQSIAKAVGLGKSKHITVLDATAGMGADAFVLATLGCKVTLLERSPVVQLLLEDGLRRALSYAESEDPELETILRRMTLIKSDSLAYLRALPEDSTQVVFLDPMFPERKKSAEVKKEMKSFHSLVGKDEDADALLALALRVANNRVVVKRPKLAPFLAEQEPGYQLVGKSGRFDVYPLKAFDADPA
jgi:Protein of unknown function (DUF548).